jgi:hypothetical protein
MNITLRMRRGLLLLTSACCKVHKWLQLIRHRICIILSNKFSIRIWGCMLFCSQQLNSIRFCNCSNRVSHILKWYWFSASSSASLFPEADVDCLRFLVNLAFVNLITVSKDFICIWRIWFFEYAQDAAFKLLMDWSECYVCVVVAATRKMPSRSYINVALTVRLIVLLLVVTVSTNSSSSSFALMNEGSGRTSQYMRKSSASIDLPYTDPLVTAPPGENAPQQVWID